jgi:acyl dehydratase
VTSTQRTLRKQTGNFLEDFVPGQVFRHKGGKTVTEGLFTTFTEFAMTANPLAKNARYARAYGYNGLVCPPGLSMLVAFSQTVEDVSENARANLEYIDMRFGAPVYIGDTVEVETRVLGIKASASRPNLGIVHVQSTARKNVGEQDEAIVLTWQRKVRSTRTTRRPRRTPARSRPTRSSARSGCRPISRAATTSASRTSRTRTPISRTSSPARASSTRAAAP